MPFYVELGSAALYLHSSGAGVTDAETNGSATE